MKKIVSLVIALLLLCSVVLTGCDSVTGNAEGTQDAGTLQQADNSNS